MRPTGGAGGHPRGPLSFVCRFSSGAFIFSWESGNTFPFRGGRETKERNKKLSWFSCKHSVRCRAGTQQERGTEERQGQRTVGAERPGEKRWGARDHRFRAWVGVGCQGEGEGKGLISQRVEGTRGGGNPYTEWQTGPGGREPLGSYYSLNILPILGSGDAKVSQIDTCLLL